MNSFNVIGEGIDIIDGYEMALMNPKFDTWQDAYDYCETYDGFKLIEPYSKNILKYAKDQQRKLGHYDYVYSYSKS